MKQRSNSSPTILVLSDNPCLLACFQRLVAERVDYVFDYAYSYNNKSPSSLVAMGCRPLNIRSEADRLATSYRLAISIHCKQIFPRVLVERIRCVNLHPGLNPHNRGWYPQVFSILDGSPLGATLHEMVPEIDRGPVIAQIEVEVFDHDTSRTAYERVQRAELELLTRWIDRVISGDYEVTITSEGNYNSISDFKDLCRLDLDSTMSLGSAIRLLRALSHPPFRNAYYIGGDGRRVYLTLSLEQEGRGV